jgi:intracellular septation protein A
MSQRTTQADVVEIAQLSSDGHVDEDKTGDDIHFPEGGWQAWMTIAGAYVNGVNIYTFITMQANRFWVQFATFGYGAGKSDNHAR